MPQVFSRRANGIAAMILWGMAVLTAGSVAAAVIWSRSDFVNAVGWAPVQPVPFSHAHHAGDLGIDCRYCHTGVETSDFAGVPPTAYLHDLPFPALDQRRDAGAGT